MTGNEYVTIAKRRAGTSMESVPRRKKGEKKNKSKRGKERARGVATNGIDELSTHRSSNVTYSLVPKPPKVGKEGKECFSLRGEGRGKERGVIGLSSRRHE